MMMRKFIITLHEDGSIQWNEYEEPARSLKDAEKRGYEKALGIAKFTAIKLKAEALFKGGTNYVGACDVVDAIMFGTK